MSNSLGEAIKEYRHKNKLTQEEFAKLIDKSIPTVRKYENGERIPPTHVLNKICELLRCNVSEFFPQIKAKYTSPNLHLVRALADSLVEEDSSLRELTKDELIELTNIVEKIIRFKASSIT